MPKKKPKNKIPLVPIFHIFCEGEKTEPYYIKGYISHFHSEKRNIILVENTKKNTPVQLVEVAVNHKASSPNDGDVYWVVFDRESTIKYSHELHLKAVAMAKKHKIEIAISNVCFELWLLLHLQYTTASFGTCDDLLTRSNLKKLLKARGINNYDKGYAFLFDALKNDISDALKNAERVKQNAIDTAENGKEKPCYLNPYTDVHELFVDIDNFINNKGSCRMVL